MTTYADQTDFPKIYSKTYWGSFKYEPTSPDLTEVIKNRNEFAVNKKIKSSINYAKTRTTQKKQIQNQFYFLQNMKQQYVDHIEYFDTGISVIGISSAYDSNNDEEVWQAAGFKKNAPLYSKDQTTYSIELFY